MFYRTISDGRRPRANKPAELPAVQNAISKRADATSTCDTAVTIDRGIPPIRKNVLIPSQSPPIRANAKTNAVGWSVVEPMIRLKRYTKPIPLPAAAPSSAPLMFFHLP